MVWSERLPHGSGAALSDGERTLNYTDLLDAIRVRAEWLARLKPRCVAIELENGVDWVLFDMACAEAGIPSIPIPAFFTESQRTHTLESAGVDLVLMDAKTAPATSLGMYGINYIRRQRIPVDLPECTAKITFTSGSSGRPKGVCLSLSHQLATARALAQAIELAKPVHLSILPLATLLENVAGVYAPLLCGGTVYVPDNRSLGFLGSRVIEPQKLLDSIGRFTPDSMILVPELLAFLVNAVSSGWRPPKSLQFIAVGGARVSPALLEVASACGLPVYQGYGLSECGSVVCLNTPAHNKTGSIGKPLAHVEADMVDDELVVSGNTFLGYLDDRTSWYPERCRTSDLVQRDDQGYFHFQGRRDNCLISSFGRNINPEWPESELLSSGLLQQAVVLGNARPWCVAIVSSRNELSEQQLSQWLYVVNERLPDYAQVRQCLFLNELMSSRNNLYTDNGRPNRSMIENRFNTHIDSLYEHPGVRVQRLNLQSELCVTGAAVAL